MLGLATAALLPLEPGPTLGGLAAAVAVLVTTLGAIRAAESSGSPGVPAGLILALLVVVAVLAGASLGAVRLAQMTGSTLAGRAGRTVELQAVVVEPPRITAGFLRVAARVLEASPEKAAGERVLLELRRTGARSGPSGGADPSAEIGQGSLVFVHGRVRLPRPAQDGGYDERSSLRRQGISVVVSAAAGDVRGVGRRGGLAGALDALRRRAWESLGRGPWPFTGGLLRGVVLGDKRGIDEATIEAFRRAGTAHMLAVSGLHVGSLAAAVLAGLSLLSVPRVVARSAAAGLVIVFAALTGAGPSVVRAAVMVLVVLLGQAVGRTRDPWQTLFLAAAFILARNPLALYAPGFQLSFAAVGGLFLLARPLEERLRSSLPERVAAGVAISLSATAGTAPLSLVIFGQASLAGVVANLVVVPLLPLVMSCGLGAIALGFVHPAFSSVLDAGAGVALAWIVFASRFFARVPVVTPGNAGAVLAAAAGAAAAAYLLFRVPWSRGRSRMQAWLRPRGGRSRRTGVAVRTGLVLAAGAFAGLGAQQAGSGLLGAAAAHEARKAWPATVEVRILDVGEGSAALIRTPQGHAALVDAGPSGADLASQLASLGVQALDLVLISHPHADHFGGLAEIAGQTRVGLLVDQVRVDPARGPPVSGEPANYLAIRRRLQDAGARLVEARSGMTLEVDDVTLRLFAPATSVVAGESGFGRRPGGPAMTSDELNDASLVVEVLSGGVAILLPGDAEAAALAGYSLSPVDAVVVPHHGSRGGLTAQLLEDLGPPQLACVSVGAGNSFGHPAAETLLVLQEQGMPVVRTDQAGWIGLGMGAGALHVATERSGPGGE